MHNAERLPDSEIPSASAFGPRMQQRAGPNGAIESLHQQSSNAVPAPRLQPELLQVPESRRGAPEAPEVQPAADAQPHIHAHLQSLDEVGKSLLDGIAKLTSCGYDAVSSKEVKTA